MIYDPKRSLGQNFFRNEHLAKKIVSFVVDGFNGTIVEIGPGTGVFTHLLQKTNNVIAIEKDENLFKLLSDHFSSNDKASIVNSDIMDFTTKDFARISSGEEFRVYGSLPYNLSKRIIEHLLLNTNAEDLFFIIQKEVADKYTDSKSSIIKARTDVFAQAKTIMKIDRSNFKPQPKVTSALIHFHRIETPLIEIYEYENFSKLLKQAFISPRKKLYNNLKNSLFALDSNHPSASKRPEDVSTKEYLDILKSA